MSLILCPECGHEVSTTAAACPNCARPLHAPPVVERKVIVAQPLDREGGFPTWALIPIGLLGIVLIFVAYIAFRGGDDTANTNVNVNVASKRPATDTRTTSTSTVPSTSVPASAPVPPPSQTTTVPGSSTAPPVAPAADKGTVVLNAKATSASGSTQAVKGTRFYLLEEDVETVLRAARVEPIEGNTLAGSLGLAAVFPDRYGDFQRAAMRAIAAKAKYSGTTNGSGGANLAGVDPKGYYLFGIAKIGRGFALWNSPVSVIAGDNMLNLSPQSVTEVSDPNG
ncbi:MAG TPA: zinc ribbon domain-containing protein [Pyrinomonadaceae bacterium]|nr:zinc ribbon domain-containing protein [Acidobacteriota bacterium]HQZ96338.1 zinc ribbon domain-containing protein [Pyrinomonadaceae bacterium]